MVAMEGQLKKRGAKMPVMYDRYCVATWETDQALNKYVLLRSYKNQKNYLQQPGKPLSACTLKCFGDWDGKGNFRRYQHAFLMETREGQVFLCAAPSEAEKTKWLEFMSNASPIPARGESASDLKQLADGGGAGLKLNKRLSMRFMNQALQNQASDVKTARASEDQDESDDSGDESDVRSTTDDEFSLDEHLGLCDCAKSDEPERSPSGSVSSDHDENRNEDESPRVQTPLPVLNVDSSEVLDAYPIASPAHGAHLSDLTDEEEVSMPVDFVQPAAATFKAPTVACAQVVDEITSAQTAQASVKEMSAPVAAPAPASISSPPITRTLSAESRAASPASTADVATRVLEKTEQAAAPLPLPAKKAEAELALLAQQDASGAVVPEIPAPVKAAAVAAASRAIHVFEATADEAAPEPLIPVAIAARAQVPVENSPTPSAVVKIEAVKEKRASDVIAIDAPAVAITTDATPSTPALPLAEEAGGSLSPPPVIAVRAVETMPLEPTTPTARSLSSQQQRMASATPLELGTGSNTNGVVDDDDDSDSQLSSSSSDDGSPSPRRPRGRANSSVVPQSFEPFATPTRLRRYSFSSALAPVRASHAFAIGSPIKQSFLEPHLGYVHSGLSTMVPSFPGLLTSLSRQQSVDEREEFDGDDDQQQGDGDATLHNEDNSAFSTADIDEV